jgi:hypothetical protein
MRNNKKFEDYKILCWRTLPEEHTETLEELEEIRIELAKTKTVLYIILTLKILLLIYLITSF